MKNSALKSIEADCRFASADGYSIVTGSWEKLYHCLWCAKFLGVAGLVIPFFCIICFGLIEVMVWGVGIWIWRHFIRYLKWTFSAFMKPKKEAG